jgi:hypothetical protein
MNLNWGTIVRVEPDWDRDIFTIRNKSGNFTYTGSLRGEAWAFLKKRKIQGRKYFYASLNKKSELIFLGEAPDKKW